MSENSYRWERIERLFSELRYEIERGMMDGGVDETIGYSFIVPISKSIPDGVVRCEFRSRPVTRAGLWASDVEPKLRVIDGGRL